MKKEIILNYAMSGDFQSDWLEVNFESFKNARYKLESVSISYNDAGGSFPAAVSILLSNDMECYTIAETFPIESASNASDAIIADINTSAEYMRIKYTQAGITSGRIKIILLYRKQ